MFGLLVIWFIISCSIAVAHLQVIFLIIVNVLCGSVSGAWCLFIFRFQIGTVSLFLLLIVTDLTILGHK